MPNERPRVFLDLDKTMYNTGEMFAPIEQDMAKLVGDPLRVKQVAKQLSQTGYSFKGHLQGLGVDQKTIREKVSLYDARLKAGDAFLFPDVLQALQELSQDMDCVLLTFGDPTYQRKKFDGLKSLHELITEAHFVHADVTKGDIIASYGRGPAYFKDDTPEHLIDVIEKAPWTGVYRILRPELQLPAHPGDVSQWKTRSSVAEAAQDILQQEAERKRRRAS